MAPPRKYIVNNDERYGRLITLEEVKVEKDLHHRYHRCKCDCGNITVVRDSFLCRGITKSCGCLWNDTLNEYQKNNSKSSSLPIGYICGLLNVIEDLGVIDIKSKREHCYRCRCECGNTVVVRQNLLKNHRQYSCGCRKNDNPSKVLSEKARLKREYPEWLTNFLINDKDIQGIKDKIFPYDTKLHFRCSHCGASVEKPIAYVINTNKDRDVPIVLCLNCSNHRSVFEENVYQYISSILPDIEIKRNVWGVIRDNNILYELDIYIPSRKVAIECNGDYFHSEQNGKPEKYHLNKFKLAEEKGIHLIQIFESTWKSSTEKIKSFLKDLLCKTNKVFARKCSIIYPTINQVKDFYNKNHLQGYSNHCNITFALQYDSDIVAMMSFCNAGLHHRNRDINSYELSRYAVKSGYTVIGGPSKLLSLFEKTYDPDMILSYSDNDYFSGNMYSQLGFTFEGIPRPRYHWYFPDQTVRTRESCQLKHLSKQYPKLYEESLKQDGNKETYIMTALKAVKVWHSGNKRWVKYY